MMLLAPWALWFLVVAGGVVALYLLKIKRRSATVPALDFWLALAGQTRVHSLFNRLKRLLSMLLWLAIVACLILALGNPIFSIGKIKPRAIAIVVDNSASMQATEAERDGLTRLELAKKAVAELTGGRPVTDQWLLIEATREARVVQPWTIETRAVQRAATEMRPFYGSADVAKAVELAGQLLVGKPDPCIVVVSDGDAGRLAKVKESDPRVVQWPIGKTRENVGVCKLAVRRDRQNGNYQALIGVFNSGEAKLETSVTLELDGRSQSVELVSAEAGATWEKIVAIDAPNGGVLRVALDRADALAVDDEAFASLEPIRPAVVWLVSAKESAFFFEHALASMEPLVSAAESLTISPEQYEQVVAAAGAAGSTVKRADLVVFNGWTPTKMPAAGRFVVVNACPEELGTVAAEEIERPELHMDPAAHPITQHVTLQGSRLAKARRVELKKAARVLAHTAEAMPLVALVEEPGRQTLLLAFDVLESDLPFRNAFPLLMRNTVAYMHEEAPTWLRGSYAVGEVIRPVREMPTGVAAKLFAVRGEKSEEVKAVGEAGVYAGMEKPGAVRLEVGEERSLAAIHVADAAESDVRVTSVGEDAATALGVSRGVFGGLPWVTLAIVAAVGLAFEWLSYHYRWTE